MHLFIHACDKHWMFGNPRLLNLVGMPNVCGQVRNTSMNRRLGPRQVNTMCIELRAHEYYVMVSSVGESEVFDEQESPEMTEALLLRLLSHRLKVLKRVLMRGDEDLDLIGVVRTL